MLVFDCLINCIGVLTIICFNVLINLLNLHYIPGVSFYLVYLLSYSLIIQNLGINMYMG